MRALKRLPGWEKAIAGKNTKLMPAAPLQWLQDKAGMSHDDFRFKGGQPLLTSGAAEVTHASEPRRRFVASFDSKRTKADCFELPLGSQKRILGCCATGTDEGRGRPYV